MALFEARGFDEVSAAEIAAAADLSTRTFFRYFATKDDVIFGPMTTYSEALVDLVREHGSTRLQNLRDVLVSYAEFLEEHREDLLRRCRIVSGSRYLEMRGLEISRSLAADLGAEMARQAGREEGDLRAQLLASGLVTVVMEVMAQWRRAGASEPLPDAMQAGLGAVHDVLGHPAHSRD